MNSHSTTMRTNRDPSCRVHSGAQSSRDSNFEPDGAPFVSFVNAINREIRDCDQVQIESILLENGIQPYTVYLIKCSY